MEHCSVYGPCVETVMIEKVAPGQLPVYGRMVLRSAAMIPVVLNGRRTAKFLIKGRHLWARIYVPSSKLSYAWSQPPTGYRSEAGRGNSRELELIYWCYVVLLTCHAKARVSCGKSFCLNCLVRRINCQCVKGLCLCYDIRLSVCSRVRRLVPVIWSSCVGCARHKPFVLTVKKCWQCRNTALLIISFRVMLASEKMLCTLAWPNQQRAWAFWTASSFHCGAKTTPSSTISAYQDSIAYIKMVWRMWALCTTKLLRDTQKMNAYINRVNQHQLDASSHII